MSKFKPVLCALIALVPAFSEDTRLNNLLEQLRNAHSFSQVVISPDGRWVAWGESDPNDRLKSSLYVAARDGSGKPRRISGSSLSSGNESPVFQESDPAWSPDSKQIAFLSNAGSDQQQVFTAAIADGRGRRLTNLKGYLTGVRWSPTGKQIAFLFAENGGGGGPLQAVPAQTGAIESELHNQRLTVVNPAGADLRQLSPPELNVYEYDWSPKGDRFAAIAAPGPADNNWWIAQLYSVDSASGKMRNLYRPPVERQLAVPRWSPDGSQIAFIGGLMSDEGFNGGDIFVIDAAGGEPRDVTLNRKRTPTWVGWRSKSELVFTEDVDGGGALSLLRLPDGESETLWQGTQQLHDGGNYPNFSMSADGKTSALIRTSWEQAPEIWAGPVGNWQQLTRENATQRPHWGKAESLVWNNDGFRVQGWLLYPDNFEASKRYPMIVEIHGGPSNLKTAAWPSSHFDMSVMASLGYFVFFPNPRGSYSEGEAFTQANVKDFGSGDLRDVLAGVDAVLKKAPVDEARIGVTGWSYGGFMTMWTVTQTNRFRAAVAGAGIANWLSYYGENSIDEWMIPFFGASVYDDPAVYAKSSPITYIKQVKTPTLVIVGERDGECPAPQSFEFWHALKTLKVPAELVVYPGEGHAFHDPKDDADRMRRAVAWFDLYLNNPAAKLQ